MKITSLLLIILSSFTISFAQNPNPAAPISAEADKLSAEVVKLFQAQKYAESLPLAKKAISITEKELGKNNLALASEWRNLAYVQYNLDDKKGAANSFDKAFSIYEKNQPLSGKNQKLYIEMIEAVAIFDAGGGNLMSAKNKFSQAISMREKISGEKSRELANPLSKLAEINEIEYNYEAAEPLLNRALEVSVTSDGKLDEAGKNIYNSLFCLLTKLHRDAALDQLRERFYPDEKAPKIKSDQPPKNINGGVINGMALSLPKPDYPSDARAKRVSGTVEVRVLIDETGKIISACAISGARELHRASERAARESKFSPTSLEGKPVKVSGIITYNYVP